MLCVCVLNGGFCGARRLALEIPRCFSRAGALDLMDEVSAPSTRGEDGGCARG